MGLESSRVPVSRCAPRATGGATLAESKADGRRALPGPGHRWRPCSTRTWCAGGSAYTKQAWPKAQQARAGDTARGAQRRCRPDEPKPDLPPGRQRAVLSRSSSVRRSLSCSSEADQLVPSVGLSLRGTMDPMDKDAFGKPDEAHLTVIRQGVGAWNTWRTDHPQKRCAHLRGADLTNASLAGANLNNTNLRNAYLSRADLRGADLSWAALNEARLNGADCSGADLRHAYLARPTSGPPTSPARTWAELL